MSWSITFETDEPVSSEYVPLLSFWSAFCFWTSCKKEEESEMTPACWRIEAIFAVLEPSGMVTSTSCPAATCGSLVLEPRPSLGSTSTKKRPTKAATPARTATTMATPLRPLPRPPTEPRRGEPLTRARLVAAAVRAER